MEMWGVHQARGGNRDKLGKGNNISFHITTKRGESVEMMRSGSGQRRWGKGEGDEHRAKKKSHPNFWIRKRLSPANRNYFKEP